MQQVSFREVKSQLTRKANKATHSFKTRLINWRMGMKVIFVRLLVSERRKVVAAETGVSNASNSSATSQQTASARVIMLKLTNGNSDIFDRVSSPLFLLSTVEAELGEDV